MFVDAAEIQLPKKMADGFNVQNASITCMSGVLTLKI
jgi:hypothetical protein